MEPLTPAAVPPSPAADGSVRGRDAEHRFRTLAALSGDWYWEQDAQLRFVSLTGDLKNQSGFTVEEHIGKTRWELPMLGVTPQQMADHRALLEARLPFRDFEFQRPLTGGGHHWVSISGDPMFDAAGRFIGYCGVGRNIDRAKQAELALQAANAELGRQLAQQSDLAERLALALEGSGAGTWSLNLATGEVRYDAGWFALVGLPPDTPASDSGFFESLVHPDDRPRVREAMRSHLRGDAPIYYTELRMRHSGGHWVWIGTRGRVVRRDANGRALVMSGTHLDIGPVVALREQTQRQTEQLQALIDSANIGMSVNTVERPVYMNAAYARLLGHDSVAAAMVMTIDEMVPPADRERARDRRQRALHGERLPMARMSVLDTAGRPIPVLTSVSRIDWDGEPHLLSIIQAASDRDLLAVQVDATRERYNRLLSQQREAYSARAVRDLRDALGSDVTGVSLLLAALRARVQAGQASVDEQLTMLDRQQQQVGHLAVNARRIAKGLMPVVMDAGGLPAALEQFADQARAAWELDCVLDVQPDACPPSNEACTHLFRIVQEAARNAVRHGDANTLRVTLRRNGALGVMQVEDDGYGFDADAVLTEEQTGTGLRTMMALASAVTGRIVFGRAAQGGAAMRVEFELE